MPLLLLFIIVPIAEIAVIIQASSLIGLWPTLGLIMLTAVLGIVLLKSQGLATLTKAQAQLRTGEAPIVPMLDGLMLAIAGTLLLTPGFITDAVGFALLIPPIRAALRRWLKTRVIIRPESGQTRRPSGAGPHGDTIEAEYDVVKEPDPDSPWRDDNR